MLSNVVTFLWRTLYLQGIRRHGIATLIELLIVAGFFYFLSYSQAQPEPLSKESEEKEASSALTAPPKVTDIVYAPDSDYNEKLMKAVADEIYRLVTSRRIGPERKQSRSYLYRAREGILDVDALIPADSDENHKASDVLLTMARLPGWVFDGLTASYAQQLQAALSLVFLIPLVRRINAIQYEFSTGTAPSYWNPEDNANTAGMLHMNKDPARFEEMPPDSKVIMDINGLTKVFGYKPALSGVDLKVYSSRITVLLGHNGAGKTTLMSILTGMLSPTSGKATVCGYDVSTQRQNVRRRVSFCQQTDIFFDDLTCAENVLYFGSLKGAKRSKLAKSVTETLCLVGIGDKANRMPKELSGGMKRRLSMAMTLVSEPDLLILDEPSAGMDPETRRNVWDVLQKVAKQRTLLLSSHDMEEADAIADQIVIMAAGVVVCTGSTTFLKKACGVGYKVTFTKVPQVFKLHDAMAVVQRTIPHAVVDDDKKEEVCIALGTMENENFPRMFRMLEGSMKRLGISSIGVSVASMKDVYLKINMDWAPGGKGREDPVDEKVIEAVSKPISKRRTMTRSFSALFHKRLLSLVRSWDLYVVFFLGPLVLLALATWLRPQQSLLKTLKNQEETLDVPIKLGTHFPDSTVVLGEAPATNLSKALRVLIESESCTVHATGNVTKELHEIIEDDFAAYILTYPMAVAFQSNTIRMMPNPTSAITSPIIINLVHTAWLRVLAAQPTLQNNITVTYLVAVPFEPC
ncbi:hypothetical protein HPB51_028858 [Rhipicephalus microplus]|uniref:ABC transporter domain-containing protein n=1 Tax=Rhipicephalus microplus TaxID=6941 RepID=A0A9J6CWC2_RHIMP|nr:hypothetical protein HPB51_028858 [Rhipicephalus microplus]